jgi:hypothetical protein
VNGDFSGVNYTPDDPDCWWTFDKCVTPKAPGLLPDIATMPEVSLSLLPLKKILQIILIP